MAGDSVRMGLEMEFHYMRVRWQLQEGGKTRLWPGRNKGSWPWAPISDADPALLVPEETSAMGPEDGIQWESLWGFRVVHDSTDDLKPSQNPDDCFGAVIIEFNTSAQPVDSQEYWVTARLCLREWYLAMVKFETPKMAQQKWVPLQTLIDEYNGRVDALQVKGLARSHAMFRLRLADRVQLLQNGSPSNILGVQQSDLENKEWIPHFTVSGQFTDLVDIQVNYQVDSQWLGSSLANTVGWTYLWGSCWVSKLGSFNKQFIDPYVGDLYPSPSSVLLSTDFSAGIHGPTHDYFQSGVPADYVYRTQLYAAVWRTARQRADGLLTTHVGAADIAALTNIQRANVLSFLTYLLAASAVSAGTFKPKNCWPQLPKTSPASTGKELRQDAVVATVLRNLAQPAVRQAAWTIITGQLRDMTTLVAIPGNLPRCRPVIVLDEKNMERFEPYPECRTSYNMLTSPFLELEPGLDRRVSFERMWKTAMDPDPGNDPVAANLHGFQTRSPWCVPWANKEGLVRTPVPAKRLSSGGVAMTFESRYNASILNIGFNPRVAPCLFNRSYNSMLRVLSPATWMRSGGIFPLIDDNFPDDPKIEQNFSRGIH